MYSDFMQYAFPTKTCQIESACQAYYQLRETGPLVLITIDQSKPFVRKRKRVLNTTGENPEVSTRRIAMFEGVDHTIMGFQHLILS